MPVVGTEQALTIDANVVNYYFIFINGHPLPPGLRTQRMRDFCTSVIAKYPIAYNDFIKTEYESVVSFETIKNWLAKRLQDNLAIKVECESLPRTLKKSLGEVYGFDCRSKDSKYLETCLNTFFKHLITENIKHFDRPRRAKKRRSMRTFLKYKTKILIYTIDQCCSKFLDSIKVKGVASH